MEQKKWSCSEAKSCARREGDRTQGRTDCETVAQGAGRSRVKAPHCLYGKRPAWLESGVSTFSSESLRSPHRTTGQDRLLWGTVKRSGPEKQTRWEQACSWQLLSGRERPQDLTLDGGGEEGRQRLSMQKRLFRRNNFSLAFISLLCS